MSTTILMAMGAEQSTKQLVAQDVEKLGESTFAQTFDANVEIAPAIVSARLEKAPLVASPLEPSNGSAEPTAKNLMDVPLAASARPKLFAGQLKPAQAESKDNNAAKTAPSPPLVVAGPKVQEKTEEVEVQGVEPGVETGESQTEAFALGQVVPTHRLQTEGATPLEQQPEGDQIQLSPVQTPVSRREAAATGRTQETASEKKPATKAQAGDATYSVVPVKNGAEVVPPVADATQSMHGVAAQVVVQALSAVPAHSATSALPVAVAAPVASSRVALSVEGGGSGVVSGDSSSSGTKSFGVATASNEVSGSSKDAAHGGKISVVGRATTPGAPIDPSPAAKSDTKEERPQGAPANAGGEGDTKARASGEASVAVVHASPPSAEVAAGTVAQTVSGLTKPAAGDGSAPTAGLPNELKEQEGSGGVARGAEPMPQTLSATPTVLEVGIPDGTHGWLKVRAEMVDGGGVNASVSAPSAASQEMLHRELPSLTAYLQAERVTVNTVVVHPMASAGAESRGIPAGTESGTNGDTPRGSDEGGKQQGSVESVAGVAEDGMSYQGLQGVDEDGMLPLAMYGSGGSWLSVRA